jgi:hypothetical protein
MSRTPESTNTDTMEEDFENDDASEWALLSQSGKKELTSHYFTYIDTDDNQQQKLHPSLIGS